MAGRKESNEMELGEHWLYEPESTPVVILKTSSPKGAKGKRVT